MRSVSRFPYRGACLLYAPLCLLMLCAPSFGVERRPLLLRAAQAAPDELTELVRQATLAVNRHEPKLMTPFLAPQLDASAFAWTAEITTRVWQGDRLSLPNPGADSPLVVFHAWHTCESDGDHIHRLVHTPQGLRLGAEIPETDPGGFRVRDHDLHVAFDPVPHLVHVTDQVRIERTQESIPKFCLLRLSQDFRIGQCRLENQALPFRQAGGILIFAPPPSKTFLLTLDYSGVVQHRETDYFRSDEMTLNSYWYPHIARLPATATVTVTAPPGWTPIAQGELQSSRQGAGGALTVTYRNDVPACYFSVDAGRYHITMRRAGERKLYAYLLRNDPGFANACLDQLAAVLAFYDSHFSHFPYTRYTLVETRGSFAGALEGYSLATFAADMLSSSIAHEAAHTWWGGLIPCAYTRSMWDEGFADYSDNLYQRSLRQANSQRIGHAFGQAFETFPLAAAHDTSDSRQVAVGYDKGAIVMRVLEAEIGLPTLLHCLQTFLADHPRGEAAEWPEFEKVVDQVTGKDYRWFFRQWVERPGLPAPKLENVAARRDADGFTVEADIVQHSNLYRLNLPVWLTTQNGAPVRAMVQTAGPSTHIRLTSRYAPVRLLLDPDELLPLTASDGLNFDFR